MNADQTMILCSKPLRKLAKALSIALVFLFIFIPLTLRAQDTVSAPASAQNDEAVRQTVVSIGHYDSMLNSYYAKRYGNYFDHSARLDEAMNEELDALADSIIRRRLDSLPTIITMTYNNEVRNYIALYLRIMRRRVDLTLTLGEHYFPLFDEVLARYNTPMELRYLPIVESALDARAVSKAGAAGLWQFIYRTGVAYGMDVNSLVDDRMDPYLATDGAARYLNDLYSMFGDWQLALAAYNCGPGTVSKAIARSGGKKDFWQLYPLLPRETRGYVPAFIAVNYVMNYYHRHGIQPSKPPLIVHFDTIHLRHDAYFCHIEQYTGVPVDELRQLNPQYRKDIVPSSSKRNRLALPVSKVHLFIAMEDSIYAATRDSLSRHPVNAKPERDKIVHKVKKGESITRIASRYKVSVADIRKWNNKRNNTVKVGERLVIYRTTATKSNSSASQSASTANTQAGNASDKPAQPVRYTVKQGDTLTKIASRYGTSAANLRKWNNLSSDAIRVGQTLIVKK